MKDFLLKKKWVGFFAILIYSLIVSAYVSGTTKEAIVRYGPTVAAEIEYFLPITIENGEIVEPKDTIISKTYGEGWQSANVVLDTRVDQFEPSSLQGQGFYVSRQYIYTVTNNEIKIKSLKDMPNATIDKEVLDSVLTYLEKNASRYIFPFLFFSFLIGALIGILLYTVVMHWLMAIVFKVNFGHTLRINTLSYVVLSLLILFTTLNLGILMTFVLMLGINFAVNYAIKTTE